MKEVEPKEIWLLVVSSVSYPHANINGVILKALRLFPCVGYHSRTIHTCQKRQTEEVSETGTDKKDK